MATIDEDTAPARTGARWGAGLGRRVGLAGRRLARAISSRAASSLTRRILVLNLGGLVLRPVVNWTAVLLAQGWVRRLGPPDPDGWQGW